MNSRTTTASESALSGIEFEGLVLGRHLTPLGQGEGGLRLDRSAYTLLTRLVIAGPMTIGQLSDAFGLDASTLNRQTARLVKDGLARRIADPEGGMARKFEVTEQGHAHLDGDRQLKLAGLAEVLSDWSSADVELLAEMLHRFNAAIERRDGRPWPRGARSTPIT
ncbi:MarR family winged helix-turn-helix transcriptional regulator [Nocardioides insulae]|uniref:MarR family winged helix-turn-helix transcriptional regulator n=1 Tax=Nocardioides insulae TaxID=394734 RepID=UPI0004246A71|nr:MarR family transcriptional regulator [Nocardioides insulae]